MMVKEVPAGDYIMIQHSSGRCLHPDYDRMSAGVRLVIGDACDNRTSMKFRKVLAGSDGSFVLQHFSKLCMETRPNGDSEMVVLGADCSAELAKIEANATRFKTPASVMDLQSGVVF